MDASQRSLGSIKRTLISSNIFWAQRISRYWRKQERQVVDVKTVVHYRLNRYETLGKSDSTFSSIQIAILMQYTPYSYNRKSIKMHEENSGESERQPRHHHPYSLSHGPYDSWDTAVPLSYHFVLCLTLIRPLNEIIDCWSEPVARFTSEWPHFLPSLLIALIDQLSVEGNHTYFFWLSWLCFLSHALVYKAHARGVCSTHT